MMAKSISVRETSQTAKMSVQTRRAAQPAGHSVQAAKPAPMQATVAAPLSASPEGIAQLQRQFGNRAVHRMIQRAQREAPIGLEGGDVSSSLQGQINSARSSGQPLDRNVSAQLGGAMGADFSGVRVHTGSQADGLNRSLSARAFTTGSDIFFSQGAYNPGTRNGKQLLAHELAHVVQQSGFKTNRVQTKLAVGPAGGKYEQEADQMAGRAMRETTADRAVPQARTSAGQIPVGRQTSGLIQRATVTTMGGTWKTQKYDPVMVDGKPGGEIIIEFEPNDLVDSEKIGLFQKIEKVHNGKNLDAGLIDQKQKGTLMGNASITAASRTTGQGHWDRALDKSNPVYGAPDLGAGQSVSKTPLSKFDVSDTTEPAKRSNYQLGYSYKPFFGKKKKRDAMLHDKPNMPGASTGSEMIFETAAMSIAGKQKNVYYGSVKWGWRITKAFAKGEQPKEGDITLEPFSVVSMGTPSAEMKGLADVWNQAETTTAKGKMANTQVPTVGHDTSVSEAQFSDKTEVQKAIKSLETALTGKGLAANNKQNMQFELKALKQKLATL